MRAIGCCSTSPWEWCTHTCPEALSRCALLERIQRRCVSEAVRDSVAETLRQSAERGIMRQVEMQRRHRNIAFLDCFEIGAVVERVLDRIEPEPVIARSEERRVGKECVSSCRSR